MHLDDPYRALPFVLQQQARAQAGVPAPSATSLREMSGCPAMLDVAGTFASAERSSSSSSPLDLIEMNGGKEPVGILQPLRDLARTMDDAAPLLERWGSSRTGTTTTTSTRTFATSASSPSAAVAAIPFSDVVQDSPMAMPGIIEELAMPSPSSAGLASSSSEDASSSLFDFASLGGGGGGGTSMPDHLTASLSTSAAADAAAAAGGTAPTGNNASLDFDPATLWNSNNGLDAIEALLKIQQAALG